MWRRACRSSSEWGLRRSMSTAVRRRRLEDEGDWFYASEWWGSSSDGHTVLRSHSDRGNGVVSVVAYPSSRPSEENWKATEQWLQQRYSEMVNKAGEEEKPSRFTVLGYQWRSLRFNDETRQSTVKVMAAYRASEPGSVFLMRQPHCLAVPYLKSMVSSGLTTMASCGYDLESAVSGKKEMRVLCIGHGGGSLPLFLASKIQGAIIHIVEIDPLVISASVEAMGFPSFSVMTSPVKRASSKPTVLENTLWSGTHERLHLHESDAERFVLETSSLYDLIFIDAYDGDDIFPRALWDPDSPFLKSLADQLHPDHGTVVVNLHSDSELLSTDGNYFPIGKYVSKVGRAYKNVLVGNKMSGLGFTVSVPWICNSTLVVSKGFGSSVNLNSDKGMILETLLTEAANVDHSLNLPFSCLNYMKNGFVLLD